MDEIVDPEPIRVIIVGDDQPLFNTSKNAVINAALGALVTTVVTAATMHVLNRAQMKIQMRNAKLAAELEEIKKSLDK